MGEGEAGASEFDGEGKESEFHRRRRGRASWLGRVEGEFNESVGRIEVAKSGTCRLPMMFV